MYLTGKKIIVACDSFKGSLSSREAGEAVAHGVKKSLPDARVTVVPVGDGGEGTMEAVVSALGGCFTACEVVGPSGTPVAASYGLCPGNIAVMEMASACGLTLLREEERNPLLTSTFGLGGMISDALGKGCREFFLGIGGSATNDCGMGMLAALGARFFDNDNKELAPSGAAMTKVARIDLPGLDSRLSEARFVVACDVDNPMCGPRGAARVFAPQKGATPAMVEMLEAGARSYTAALSAAVGRDLSGMPGAGAAGGLGMALAAAFNTRLEKGIDMVLRAVGFDDILADAALVITGEGRIDSQTLMGKTPYGILSHSKVAGVPVVAVAGSVDDTEALIDAGFAAVLPVAGGPCTLAEAMEPVVARHNLSRTSSQIIRLLSL